MRLTGAGENSIKVKFWRGAARSKASERKKKGTEEKFLTVKTGNGKLKSSCWKGALEQAE
jgi:hypothetical protein